MNRVVQSRTGSDGTCFRACLASILNLNENQVPDFTDEGFFRQADKFLLQYGLKYRRTPLSSKPSGYSTIEGISPRGGLHACVAYDGELIWDPHPIEDGTGQGLVEPRYYGVLEPVARGRDAADRFQELRDIIRGWSFANADGVQRRLTKAQYLIRISNWSSDKRKSAHLLLIPLRETLEEMKADGQFPNKK